MDERTTLHVKRIHEGLNQIPEFFAKRETAFSATFKAWKQRVTQSLRRVLGEDNDYTRRFSALTFWQIRMSVGERRWTPVDQKRFEDDLFLAKQLLSEALEEIDVVPPSHPPILLDRYDFHPRVKEVAEPLMEGNHFRQAILDVYIALVDAVKEKSGCRELDNTPLMQQVFSPNHPILKVSDDPDEQLGAMWLFSGAVMYIRNPKAHKLIIQADPQRTVEWLAFASVLFRVLDGSEKQDKK